MKGLFYVILAIFVAAENLSELLEKHLNLFNEYPDAYYKYSEVLIPQGDACPRKCPTETLRGDIICHESCNTAECDWDRGKCVDAGLDIIVHIENYGDMDNFSHSEWAGTKGNSLRLEGFQISFKDERLNDVLGIEYIAELEETGLTEWVSAGNFVGTRGEARRMERFAIRKSFDKYDRFKVNYQCHIQDIGDSPTYSDGEFCGELGKRVEAIYVWIQKRI